MSPRRLALAALLGLTSCGLREMPELSKDPQLVYLGKAESHPTAARLPTDLITTSDHEIIVLDGHQGRILILDDKFELDHAVVRPDLFGPAARMSLASEGGLWLARPDGAVLRVDQWGEVLQRVPVGAPEDGWKPVDAVEKDGMLVVASRDGRVGWVDPATGAVSHVASQTADGVLLGRLADLEADGGGVLAVDTTAAKIHEITQDGVQDSWGRMGMWIGSVYKPKALVRTEDGTLLVADSGLGVVQVFEESGRALGVLAHEGEPLQFGYAISITPGPQPDSFLVLDSTSGTIWDVSLSAEALARAREGLDVRRLRTGLDAPEVTDPEGCHQCHDGIVNGGRGVFDTSLHRHPIDIEVEVEVPPGLPLDEQGRIQCRTCHAPHGQARQEGQPQNQEVSPRTFLRMGTDDDSLCQSCHGENAHEGALELPGMGGTHPTGAELMAAMEKKGLAYQGTKGCLGCHEMHGSDNEQGLTRDAEDGVACAGCHEDHADDIGDHPVHEEAPAQAAAEGLDLDENGELTCRSCHSLVGGQGEALLREPTHGGMLCTTCHLDRQEFGEGPHGDMLAHRRMPCLECHDLHGDRRTSALLRYGGRASKGDPNGCLGCHGRGGQQPTHASVLGHPVDGRTLDDGTDLTCSACHDPHSPDPDPKAGCGTCHTEQHAGFERGGHGGVECLDCHPMHEESPMARGRAPEGSSQRDAACLACHDPETGRGAAPRIARMKHPAPVFDEGQARWSALEGLALFAADGEPAVAENGGLLSCQTCHLVHGPDADTPRDHLRKGGWQKGCAACHGDRALLFYRNFHEPSEDQP